MSSALPLAVSLLALLMPQSVQQAAAAVRQLSASADPLRRLAAPAAPQSVQAAAVPASALAEAAAAPAVEPQTPAPASLESLGLCAPVPAQVFLSDQQAERLDLAL